MTRELREVQCCIAGGGPAGMMLGLLLARAGVRVLVLEKHADFLRDSPRRHHSPFDLEVIAELGLLEGLLSLPHQKVRKLSAMVGSTEITMADFTHLPTRCKFIRIHAAMGFPEFPGRSRSAVSKLHAAHAH
jgi:2-polyprenyl-6-methoxyphenol hydroxylase-like FAD-dependent oxidoreductase